MKEVRILLISLLYSAKVVLISYILFFPGFGVLILPQPFLEVSFGRWTAVYNPATFKSLVWLGYITAYHFLFYFPLKHPSERKAIFSGASLAIANLTFVKYFNRELWIVVNNYVSPAYLLATVFANAIVELASLKSSSLLLNYINNKGKLFN